MKAFSLELPGKEILTANARPYDCDDCYDRKWVTQDDSSVERCSCYRNQFAVARGVPKKFKTANFKTWTPNPQVAHALKAGRTLVEDGIDHEDDLYLFGPTGTGKTRLAATLCNEWSWRYQNGLFQRVGPMLKALQPSSDNASDLPGLVLSVPLLVLDDFGAERWQATDYTSRTLLELYEHRHDEGLVTIFSSNLAPQEIRDFMGDDRLMSRIAGQCQLVEMAGADRRTA